MSSTYLESESNGNELVVVFGWIIIFNVYFSDEDWSETERV